VTTPIIAAVLASALIILQMILSFRVSQYRQKAGHSFGDGSDDNLTKRIRQHGNLAENAALFVVGIAMLELLDASKVALLALAVVFVLLRLIHVLGLGNSNASNPARAIGGLGTLGIGLIIGVYLAVIAVPMLAQNFG
jgi:uncharacterized protein